MALGKEIEKLKYDKRLLDANVARGTVSKNEKEKHLNELPDLASNVENLGLVRGGGASSSSNDGDFGSDDNT
jgi:hypothetical protein